MASSHSKILPISSGSVCHPLSVHLDISVLSRTSGNPHPFRVGWKLVLTLRFCLVKYSSDNPRARWFGCQSLKAFAFRQGSSHVPV